MNKKHLQDPRIILLLILLVAFLIRIYFFDSNREGSPDPYHHAKIAESMMQGEFKLKGRFWSPWWPATPPLYPFIMALTTFGTGNLFLSGKIVSLIAGVAVIPITYLLWRKLESKEVALLAAWLVAVNSYSHYLSIHTYRDTLFLFFSMLAFLLFYKVKEDRKWPYKLGLVLGMATLTRHEGFILMVVFLLTFIYRERKLNRQVGYFIMVFLLIVLPWHVYRYAETGVLVPPIIIEELGEKGRTGLGWIAGIGRLITLPLLILFLVGAFLTLKKKEKYLPLYLFIILFSVAHMWFVSSPLNLPRYALPLSPIMLGWASIGILSIIQRVSTGGRNIILAGVLILTFMAGLVSFSEAESKENSWEVISDAMTWFDLNSESDAVILAGEDDNVFGYFTKKRIIGYNDMDTGANILYRNGYPAETAFFNLLVNENIRYVVTYDTTHPWAYEGFYGGQTQQIFQNFQPMERIFDYRSFNIAPNIEELEFKFMPSKTLPYRVTFNLTTSTTSKKVKITFNPLKKFEKRNQTIHLYKINWEYF